MKVALTLGLCVLLMSCSSLTQQKREVPAYDVGEKIEIIGDLGVPVGTPVTITGIKKRNGPFDYWFSISKIDGKEVSRGILIEEIAHWPEGTMATLRGREIGALNYSHEPGGNYGPYDSRWKGPQQSLTLKFNIDSIVSPKSLSLKNQ